MTKQTFRKQRGGFGIENLPSGINYALPGASSDYNALTSTKGGRRRRKHHRTHKRHHRSHKRHHKRHHRSHKRHHKRHHRSHKRHHKRHHRSHKRHHSRRRRGGNPAFFTPAALLALQKLFQHNGLGL